MRKNKYYEVRSASLHKTIKNVQIIFKDSESSAVCKRFTDRRGRFTIPDNDCITTITFSKPGFNSKSINKLQINSVTRLLENKLIGYLNKLWFNGKETAEIYINSSQEFNIQLLRFGLEVEEIDKLNVNKCLVQQVPDGNFVADGLNWNDPISYKFDENLNSGLYGFRLTSKDELEQYTLNFVLSQINFENNGERKILVLASTNNWQTYNIWGGRSRYRNFEISDEGKFKGRCKHYLIKYFPDRFVNLIKIVFKNQIVISEKDNPGSFSFKPLSIKRPHPNCSIENDNVYDPFTSHLTSGEWRILAWLERAGLDYDLVSCYEFDKYNFTSKNYPAIILSTHNEYWTEGMYHKLKEFKKNGGSILNLSGNSIYRQVKFTKQYNLKCVSLKFNKTVEDESKLIGVRFDMRGYGTCAPFRVVKSDHWIFSGTELKRNELFGHSSLNSASHSNIISFETDPAAKPGMAELTGNGASGWETDKISSTAPPDVTLLAKGTNRAKGGAEMIVRENRDGSIIFSASSITFGGSLLIDHNCSQLIKNVLNKILNVEKKENSYEQKKASA